MMNDFSGKLAGRNCSAEIPGNLRDEYIRFVHEAQSRITAPTLLLGTGVMTALGGVDMLILHDVTRMSLIVRLGVALPAGLIVYAYLTRRERSLRRQYQISVGLALLYGILACGLVAQSTAPLAPIYMTANNATILFVVLMLGFPPLLAVTVAGMLILIQSAALLTASFGSGQLIALTTSISLSIAIPAFYGNLRGHTDQRQDFLARQRDAEQLWALASKNALLERLSALDPLTGLSNRRGFDASIAAAIHDVRSDPGMGAVALAMIDVDHFKIFNDTQGHLAGDEALKAIARVFARATRVDDLAVRYGGEEFAIVMTRVDPVSLEFAGSRLKTGVEKLGIPNPESPTAKTITVSVGIA